MRLRKPLVFLILAIFTLAFAVGCDEAEDAAEEALENATGYDWELTEEDFEDDTGVNTPYKWQFIFAVNLEEEEQYEMINEDFSIDLSDYEEILSSIGIDLGELDNQIVFARVAPKGNGSNGLRYANKVLVKNGTEITLDGESIEKLGPSVGASGPGWYAAYHSSRKVGFVKGEVKDCDGQVPGGDELLVLASDGPFFTYAASTDGSYALPSADGKPAMVNFDAGDCTGSDSAPVTDEENPKDPNESADNDPLEDDTNVIDAGEEDLNDPDPGAPSDGVRFEFDLADSGWAATGDCFEQYEMDESYVALFPAGTDENEAFGFLSTGSPTTAGLQSCTVTRSFTVPADASEIVVSYDFISQEYAEWVGSPYNDIFTVIVQGEFDYVINRTVNGENDWVELANGDIGFIADSDDAQYNSGGNGPYMFDGGLKWAGANNNTPRGSGVNDDVDGHVARYPVEAGSTITVLLTISDVADAIYDSAAIIDYVAFE